MTEQCEANVNDSFRTHLNLIVVEYNTLSIVWQWILSSKSGTDLSLLSFFFIVGFCDDYFYVVNVNNFSGRCLKLKYNGDWIAQEDFIVDWALV